MILGPEHFSYLLLILREIVKKYNSCLPEIKNKMLHSQYLILNTYFTKKISLHVNYYPLKNISHIIFFLDMLYEWDKLVKEE